MHGSGLHQTDLSYFPGCSLESSARESNISRMAAAGILGLNLIELEDWNCCGSSSANILDKEIAFSLAVRNLSLAPPDRPLMVMCPRCLYQLRQAHLRLPGKPEDPPAQGRPSGGAAPRAQAPPPRCCGKFLSRSRADVVMPLVNEIIASAVAVGAECMVTSCA